MSNYEHKKTNEKIQNLSKETESHGKETEPIKNQMEIPELKNKITNSSIQGTKKRISELDDRTLEITQSKQQT